METRPGRCCQDGRISVLDCGDAAATGGLQFISASLVSGRGSRAGPDVEELQTTSMLTTGRVTLEKLELELTDSLLTPH